MTILILNFLLVIFTIRHLVCLVAENQSPWHLYLLNPFLGFGILNRFTSGIYVFGYGMVALQGLTTLWAEREGKLTPISGLRTMYNKLGILSQEEYKQFTYFLRIMPYIRILGFIGITIPMVLIRVVGAVMTGYQFHGMIFILYYFPVLVVACVIIQYCVHIFTYVHLIIAQSTSYFKIRLNRVENNLNKFLRQDTAAPVSRKSSFPNELKRKAIDCSKKKVDIDHVILDLQDILDELVDHNNLIKFYLRDSLYGVGGGYVNLLVFLLGPHPWYFRIIPLIPVVFGTVFMTISFTNASQLYIRILNMAKVLHSCQCVVGRELSMAKRRAKSAPSTSRGSHVSQGLDLKSKFQVLRMIHRISSPHLRIGYTVGNGESFSDDTAAAFVSNIVGNTLMFLNAVQGQGF